MFYSFKLAHVWRQIIQVLWTKAASASKLSIYQRELNEACWRSESGWSLLADTWENRTVSMPALFSSNVQSLDTHWMQISAVDSTWSGTRSVTGRDSWGISSSLGVYVRCGLPVGLPLANEAPILQHTWLSLKDSGEVTNHRGNPRSSLTE